MKKKTTGTKIRDAIKRSFIYHVADLSCVQPTYCWDEKRRMFFIDSPAGLIRFKPRNDIAREKFRARWLNQFETLLSSQPTKKDFFKYYRSLLKDVRGATYKANLRSRARLSFGL